MAEKLKAVRSRKPVRQLPSSFGEADIEQGYEGFSQMSQDGTQALRRELSLLDSNGDESVASQTQGHGQNSSQTVIGDNDLHRDELDGQYISGSI